MNTEKLTEELGRMSNALNGIGGRLIVASMSDPVIREAHELTIQLGFELDNLINELLEQEVED